MDTTSEDIAAGRQEPPSPSLRAAFAVTIALLALVLVVAAQSPPVVEEARIGRRVELVELIRAEEARVDALAAKVEELSSQVALVQRNPAANPEIVSALNAQIDAVAAHAGLTPVLGPGLVVTLKDSVLAQSPSGDLNDLVIHEQDLQAVINALWAGGAEAMSVNGQRVLATTAIRCVGNTLLLHGSVYSPPYVIRVVADAEGVRSALGRDPAVAQFRRAVEQFELRFTVADSERLIIPAFEGSLALKTARPAGSSPQ
jgi:uncharacterized protein YlxW (UPF0749 family)